MKKLILTGAILGTSLFAANTAQIVDFFKPMVPKNVKVEVVKAEKLKELPNFELVTIKMSDGANDQIVRMFHQDGVLLPEIINLKTKKMMLKEIEKKESLGVLKKLYKDEKKSNIISIGNDPKKETMVVFTDPECPFCRKELGNIENRLKEVNVKMILTPVHGRSAFVKSYLMYKETKKAKNDSQKIAIMKKYYDPKVDISKAKVDDKEIQKLLKLKDKYMSSGAFKGVPAIFKEKDIK